MSHSMGTSEMNQLIGGTIVSIIADEGGQAHGFRVVAKGMNMLLIASFNRMMRETISEPLL